MFSAKLVSSLILVVSAWVVTAEIKAGDATFYQPAEVMSQTGIGACGTLVSSTEFLAAVSYKLFDTYPGATGNPNQNPICNKALTANYEGKSVRVTVVDRCADCEGEFNIDLTPVAFDVLADRSLGRLHNVTWDWETEDATPNATNSDATQPLPRKMLKRRRPISDVPVINK
ncbi:hypothetical protein BDQ12DRAFT_712698 [Crucibulum laeve]|uniref:RlpA-like double-psi beta-barrel-protein domain-containing protein-containing protein n=1 Tax=Crucibulum laeve TaxID=68775 RepID=A0A5C3M057_9AGAR|nr:hypothetical protein BDQ12DRAFT_712698 [Crucibulum laeve]